MRYTPQDLEQFLRGEREEERSEFIQAIESSPELQLEVEKIIEKEQGKYADLGLAFSLLDEVTLEEIREYKTKDTMPQSLKEKLERASESLSLFQWMAKNPPQEGRSMYTAYEKTIQKMIEEAVPKLAYVLRVGKEGGRGVRDLQGKTLLKQTGNEQYEIPQFIEMTFAEHEGIYDLGLEFAEPYRDIEDLIIEIYKGGVFLKKEIASRGKASFAGLEPDSYRIQARDDDLVYGELDLKIGGRVTRQVDWREEEKTTIPLPYGLEGISWKEEGPDREDLPEDRWGEFELHYDEVAHTVTLEIYIGEDLLCQLKVERKVVVYPPAAVACEHRDRTPAEKTKKKTDIISIFPALIAAFNQHQYTLPKGARLAASPSDEEESNILIQGATEDGSLRWTMYDERGMGLLYFASTNKELEGRSLKVTLGNLSKTCTLTEKSSYEVGAKVEFFPEEWKERKDEDVLQVALLDQA